MKVSLKFILGISFLCLGTSQGLAQTAPTETPAAAEASSAVEAAPAPAAPAVEAAPAQKTRPPLEVIVLVDGSTLTGIVVLDDGEKLTLRRVDGSTSQIHKSFIASRKVKGKIKVVRGEVWGQNPMRTRHLLAPSALPLRKGESYLSLKQLTILEGGVGLTDNIAIDIGSFLPGVFMGKDTLNIFGGVKAGYKVQDKLFVAGGMFFLALPFEMGLVAPMAGITYGEETGDWQVTISGGRAFGLNVEDPHGFGTALINISGQFRVSNSGALVFENWFIPGTEDEVSDDDGWGFLTLHTVLFRKINKQSSWDLGFIYVSGELALPYFEYSWFLGE